MGQARVFTIASCAAMQAKSQHINFVPRLFAREEPGNGVGYKSQQLKRKSTYQTESLCSLDKHGNKRLIFLPLLETTLKRKFNMPNLTRLLFTK